MDNITSDLTLKSLKRIEADTVLGHEGVIRGAEVDEPAPIRELPQEDRDAMEGATDHRRALIRHRIRAPHHPDVPELPERRLRADELLQIRPLVRRRGEVEVEEVVVPGVVERAEEPPHPRPVAGGAGDHVGEPRRRRRGGRVTPPTGDSGEIRGPPGPERREDEGEGEERREEEEDDRSPLEENPIDDPMGPPHGVGWGR